MGKEKTGSKAKSRTAGHKAYYQQYQTNQTREKRKIKKMIKANGKAIAQAYAESKNLLGFFLRETKGTT